MKIEFEIDDSKVSSFSEQAKMEFLAQVNDISEKLADEAGRIETSERLSGDVQEITSAIVKKAAELFLRRYNYIKHMKRRVFVEICAILSTSLTSILFTIAFSDLANNTFALCLGLVTFLIASVTSVISVLEKL